MKNESFYSHLKTADIKFLYEKLLGIDYHKVLFKDNVLSLSQNGLLTEAVNMYKEGVPLEYIVGKSSFFGLDFQIDRSCLIPRPETELLVEKVLSVAGSIKEPRVLDVGTGSGVIGVTLGLYRRDWQVYASDIAKESLFVAEKNIKKHCLKNVSLVCSDLTSGFGSGCFDIIVANLPYVETPFLMGHKELGIEPARALDGGKDGLVYIKKVLKGAGYNLVKGGLLFLEIGAQQKEGVLRYARKLGWKIDSVNKDYNGIDRVCVFRRLDDSDKERKI